MVAVGAGRGEVASVRQWPFEGREQELAAISAAFAGSTVPVVLVRASAGLGKTRLTREALGQLGCPVEWVAATRSAASIPFGAVAHWLPERPQPGAAGVAGLVRAVCDRVAGLGGGGRVAVGVDDAHLLDDASATVIAGLITAGVAFVVITVCTGEVLLDAVARPVKDSGALVLQLAGLPDEVMDRLIDHGLGATGVSVDTAGRCRLRTAARGNPLALRELLHGAVPGGLTELATARLAGLGEAARGVVEAVACAEPVPLLFLERLAGSPAVAAAEESGLVACERAGARVQARLDHPLFGEVARSRMPVARSRQAYRQLAGQLLATPLRRRDDVLRAAVWQVEAGEITRPDLVREGGRQAVGRASLELAERLARAARAAEPGAEADQLLAEILQYQGRNDEAGQLMPDQPPNRPADRIRWAITRAEWLYWARGDLDAAMRVYDTVAGQPTVEGARAFCLYFAGRHADALRAADSVLARRDADAQATVWATAAATASLGFRGRLDEALDMRARGLPLARAHAAALPWARNQIEVAACVAYLATGRPLAAARIAAAGYRVAGHGGTAPMMANAWALFGGIAAATQGELADADRLLAEAVAGFTAHDTFRLLRCCLAAHAWVHALLGRPERATVLMTRADGLDNGTNQAFEPWIAGWRAWVAHADGDTATARQHAARAAELAAAAGTPGIEALARYDQIRLGAVADLTRLAALTTAPTTVLATAARALADGDGPALARAAATLAGLGLRLHAAELATATARLARRDGQTGRAAVAAAHAAELRAARPPARTPLLADNEIGIRLTPREWQIAQLAARHTSPQIARRLSLATATVNNTLARAYTKLGITSRTQLRALLTGENPDQVTVQDADPTMPPTQQAD